MCACMHYERGVLGEYIHRTIRCSEMNVANMPYKISRHGKANTCISAGSNSETYPVHGSASEEIARVLTRKSFLVMVSLSFILLLAVNRLLELRITILLQVQGYQTPSPHVNRVRSGHKTTASAGKLGREQDCFSERKRGLTQTHLGLGIFAFRTFCCKCLIFENIATLDICMTKSFSSSFSAWRKRREEGERDEQRKGKREGRREGGRRRRRREGSKRETEGGGRDRIGREGGRI